LAKLLLTAVFEDWQ